MGHEIRDLHGEYCNAKNAASSGPKDWIAQLAVALDLQDTKPKLLTGRTRLASAVPDLFPSEWGVRSALARELLNLSKYRRQLRTAGKHQDALQISAKIKCVREAEKWTHWCLEVGIEDHLKSGAVRAFGKHPTPLDGLNPIDPEILLRGSGYLKINSTFQDLLIPDPSDRSLFSSIYNVELEPVSHKTKPARRPPGRDRSLRELCKRCISEEIDAGTYCGPKGIRRSRIQERVRKILGLSPKRTDSPDLTTVIRAEKELELD